MFYKTGHVLYYLKRRILFVCCIIYKIHYIKMKYYIAERVFLVNFFYEFKQIILVQRAWNKEIFETRCSKSVSNNEPHLQLRKNRLSRPCTPKTEKSERITRSSQNSGIKHGTGTFLIIDPESIVRAWYFVNA